MPGTVGLQNLRLEDSDQKGEIESERLWTAHPNKTHIAKNPQEHRLTV